MSTSTAAVAKPSRERKKPPSAPASKPVASKAAPIARHEPIEIAPDIPHVPEASVQLIPLARLKRAPENVRHTAAAEDVDHLADDIAAHGLLQSLIGYAQFAFQGALATTIYIVGGGRRLQALDILLARGAIDDSYEVPVLVRDQAEAIELSLSENLQKRDMNPADEFVAFSELMKPGTLSPRDLAARFGFTERYVRERLRLALLAPEILDAVRERRITLDAAKAYAATEDRDLQLDIYKAQEKSSYASHAAHSVKQALSGQMNTGSPVFKFVGAETYERDGGRYDDDLFASDKSYGGHLRIASRGILLAAAERMAKLQGERLVAELKAKEPTVIDFLVPPMVAIGGYPWTAPRAPKGKVLLSKYPHEMDKCWARARKAKVPIVAIIGVDQGGELAVKREAFFVDKQDLAKVDPPAPPAPAYKQPTAEEVAAERRKTAVDLIAWRLGVGKFAGTPLEGRAFWPSSHGWINSVEEARDRRLAGGRLVAVQIFVSDDEVAAHRDEAERQYEAELAAKAEEKARRAEAEEAHERRLAAIGAMDPQPAVVVIEGEAFFRREDGSYVDDRGLIDDFEVTGEAVRHNLGELLDEMEATAAAETFATRVEFDAAQAAAGADA